MAYNIYASTSSAPSNMQNNGAPSTTSLNQVGMNQNPGISNPHYSALTYANPNSNAYANVGGGITYGIATPDEYASYQLNNMLKSDNPYMQLAKQQGLNTANQRGLLNSSIAAGNSQAAAIQAAAPIATNDANMLANLQTTNLKDKTAEDQSTISAQATTGAAAIQAAASQANTAASLQEAIQAQRENLAYQGEQQGLTRDFTSQFAAQQEGYNLANTQQQYYDTSGLSNQNYIQNWNTQSGLLSQNLNNQLAYGQFQLGSNLLQGQQNFYSSAGLSAMNNPAIMGNPQAFGGFMQFISNPFSSYIDSIFSNLFGGTP